MSISGKFERNLSRSAHVIVDADAIGEAQSAADDGARSVADEAPIDDNAEAEADTPFAVAAE